MTSDDPVPDTPPQGFPGSVAPPDQLHDSLPIADASVDARRAALRDVLTESRRRGFLGPGPIEDHIVHASGFVPLVGSASCVLDLGSGGGLPGLVMMTELPTSSFVLLDASTRRCEFLTWAVERLGVADRARVLCGRAEALAREPALRAHFPVVVSRSFGGPAVTAECAVGFLDAPGARLLVSEPPDAGPARWPAEGLDLLGLRSGDRHQTGHSTIQVLELVSMPSQDVPRRVGVPSKRPRF